MDHQERLEILLKAKIIPVIRGASKETILPVVKVLQNAGIQVVEITVEEEAGYDALKTVADNCEMILAGAGTVWNIEQAKKVVKAGANFIFSPILEEEVVKYTKKEGLVSIPGVFTPGEIYKAHQIGADLVKIFPIDILGPAYLKNIRQPLPAIPKIVTGGIHSGNIQEYFDVGAVGVGIGSNLVNMKKISQDPKTELQRLDKSAKQYRKFL